MKPAQSNKKNQILSIHQSPNFLIIFTFVALKAIYFLPYLKHFSNLYYFRSILWLKKSFRFSFICSYWINATAKMKIRRRIRPHELYWDAWFHQNGPIGTNAPTIVVDADKESDFGFAQAMSYVQSMFYYKASCLIFLF